VAGVINQQNVVNVAEVASNLVLERCARWMFSRFCRKNSAVRPEVGVPTASPSFWIRIFLLLVK